jgi:hypothetical protein
VIGRESSEFVGFRQEMEENLDYLDYYLRLQDMTIVFVA